MDLLRSTSVVQYHRTYVDEQHRDLHEGQILISPASISGSSTDIDCLSESKTGVKVTIIDFGLSRLSLPGKTSSTWSDLPVEVYEGKGDQWDVYRAQRDLITDDWAGFHPETNVLVSLFAFDNDEADGEVATLHCPIPTQPNKIITQTSPSSSSASYKNESRSKIRHHRTKCDRGI